jgi:hypothetical protein
MSSKRQELLDVAAEFYPPKILNSPHNTIITALGYTMWPHLFLELNRRFGPEGELNDLLVVLLHLWDATVGKAQYKDGEPLPRGVNPKGRLSTSQIPLRRQQKSKWMHALLKSEFFKREETELPDKRGSLYEYDNNTSVEDWVFFFAKAQLAVALGGDKDEGAQPDDENKDRKKIATTTFANFFIRARLGVDWKPRQDEGFTPGTAAHDTWLVAQKKEEEGQ